MSTGMCEHGYRLTDGTVADWCPECKAGTMSTTGATESQLKASLRRYIESWDDDQKRIEAIIQGNMWTVDSTLLSIRRTAEYLVPPGSAIIDAEDVAAIRRAAELIELVRDSVDEYEDAGIMFACSAAELLDEFHRIMPSSPADLDRLRRIGGEG